MIVFENKQFRPVSPPPATAAREAVPAALPEPPPAAVGKADVWRVLPLEGSFEFAYLDATGRPSLRRLAASELKVGPGKLLLGGVDADLGAYRGFRVDRIHRIQAAGSGEVVGRNILDWLLERAARQAREKVAREKASHAAPRKGRSAQAGRGRAQAA